MTRHAALCLCAALSVATPVVLLAQAGARGVTKAHSSTQTKNAAENGCQPSAAALKTAARAVASEHPDGNLGAFLYALDTRLGAVPAITISDPGIFLLYSADDLSIAIMSRYVVYRTALQESLRKMEPIDKIEPPDGDQVVILPQQMGSPDIIKVVVRRNGIIIPAVENFLVPTVERNAMGATVTLHSGDVVFPCSAFNPGAEITVTAIPQVGTNIVVALSAANLQKLPRVGGSAR